MSRIGPALESVVTKQHSADVLLVGDLASVHVRRLASTLADRGIRVHVATFDGQAIPRVGIHRLGARGRTKWLRYPLAVPSLTRVIRRTQPAIVHAHYVSSFGLMSALAVGFVRPSIRPLLIQTAWGTDLLVTARESIIRGLFARFALQRAAAVTGDSRDLLDAARRFAPHAPLHRFVFGPPSVLLAIDRVPSQIVVSTRRLDRDTRVDLVVAGFLEAERRHPQLMSGWRLVVAGDGRASNLVGQAAAGAPTVEVTGQLEQAALHELLADARVAVSVPVSDASSASLLEALAAGLVLVVNDLPANREWVDDSTAEIVPHDPPIQELADAIARAAARPLSRSKSRDAVRGVTWEAQVTDLLELYRALSPGPQDAP